MVWRPQVRAAQLKAEAALSFEEQYEALQGAWAENGREGKYWVVHDMKATRPANNGRPPRSYRLTHGDHGGLCWGKGVYCLEIASRPGLTEALWRSGTPAGPVAFRWTYLGPDLDADGTAAEEEAPIAKGRGKAKGDKGPGRGTGKGRGKGVDRGAGKGPAKGVAKGPAAGTPERRVDPVDGKAYTWEEIRMFYSSEWTKRNLQLYWAEECEALYPQAEMASYYGVKAEVRTDPLDGQPYTWDEIYAFYASAYTFPAIAEYWDMSEHAGFRAGQAAERRVDPIDSKPCTLEEIQRRYANLFSPNAVQDYWNSCRPVGARARSQGRKGPPSASRG